MILFSIPKQHLILLSSLFIATLTGCEKADPVYNRQFLSFGTITNISIIGVSHHKASLAADILEEDFQTMHNTWHAWNPGPLKRTNDLLVSGESFSAPPSLIPLFNKAKALSNASNGLFNPTIGNLLQLWGFQGKKDGQCTKPPSEEKIKQLVSQNPSVNDIILNGISIQSKNPAVKLDFGAIGKGYGIDLAIQHLKEIGIENAIINAGGDMRAIGSRQGQPWRIAIRSPSGSGIIGFIESSDDSSIFTSGNYERNFTHKGNLYHHIIDPRTGYPAKHSVAVTVIHKNATTADAAATALFVAGPDDWPQIAANMGIEHVLLIDEAGLIQMTPKMSKRVHLLNPNAQIKIKNIPQPI